MARAEKKYHYIYKTTNLKTGKFYVGMHSTNNLEDDYLGSGTRLKRSIRRNGVDNFKKEILEFAIDRNALKIREKQIVNEDLLKNPDCMNLQLGGGGGFINENHKNLFFQAAKKTRASNLSKGRETQKILWKTNPIWAQRKSKKLSKGSIGNKSFTGRRHSEETKEKMSKKASERKGDKNSQYGTMWITNKKHNRKIHKNDQIPKGWKKGRV